MVDRGQKCVQMEASEVGVQRTWGVNSQTKVNEVQGTQQVNSKMEVNSLGVQRAWGVNSWKVVRMEPNTNVEALTKEAAEGQDKKAFVFAPSVDQTQN